MCVTASLAASGRKQLWKSSEFAPKSTREGHGLRAGLSQGLTAGRSGNETAMGQRNGSSTTIARDLREVDLLPPPGSQRRTPRRALSVNNTRHTLSHGTIPRNSALLVEWHQHMRSRSISLPPNDPRVEIWRICPTMNPRTCTTNENSHQTSGRARR